MTGKTSAGLLLWRRREGRLEVLLAHPGGPLYARKDEGAWSLPKGEPEPDEPLLDAARREFAEETGLQPAGPFLALDQVQQKGGKTVHAWACEGDCDTSRPVPSNTFEMEWPPRSGRRQSFPEIDRLAFFGPEEARRKVNPAQAAFIERLEAHLAGPAPVDTPPLNR